MNWKNTPPRESLYAISDNALLFQEFLVFINDFYSDLESDYPDSHGLTHENERLLEDIVELWIEMQILDIEMRNHDFTHYKTIFIILRKFFEAWFFEDTQENHEKVFHLLQKYTALCEWDTSPLELIQKEYHARLENAQFRNEDDFLRSYGEQEMEFFLSIIWSEEETKKHKKRFQNFLTVLSEKEVINSEQYWRFWNCEDMNGYYNLFFILLEKDSLWENDSDLKFSIWVVLRGYFFWKDQDTYEALSEYDQGFEYYLHLRSEAILQILAENKVFESTEIIDTFLQFLFENNIYSPEEYQYYMSSENMVSSLCDIMYKIILGKYLSEYSELEVKWLIFLISYYNTLGSQENVKQLHEYAKLNDYSISQVQAQVLKFEDFHTSSDAFHHFLNIAMDLPNRIENLETRDFFEGEEEVLRVLERFREIWYINEEEFYEFQDRAFEISIYRLLKKLYLNWFFSGDINHVETIKDTLIAIATLISPDEIWEIDIYFQTRYTGLIRREQKSHILPLAKHISEILQEGNEQQEADLIWDFVNILGKYDRSWDILKLSGYGNSPRLVWFECIHFALTHHLLWEGSELIQTLYYQVLRYYRENNFSKRLTELQDFSQHAQEKWYNFLPQDTHEVLKWVQYLLKMIERGIYDTKQIELIEELVHTLFSQSHISEKERNVILSSKNSPAAFFNLYTILTKNWFLEMNEQIVARIQQIKAVINEILDENENPKQENEDILWYTPELRWEMVRSNTMQLIEWIKDDEIWKLDNEFFEEFLWFLWSILSWESLYFEIFGEEAHSILEIEDKEERAHALLLFIYCDFLDEDFDTMQQVHLCLKEYYYTNKDLCAQLDDIIHPYRILNLNN